MRIGLAAIVAALALLAALPKTACAQMTPRAAAPTLTMEQARARSARIDNVSYELVLALDGEAPEVTGSVVARFELTTPSGGLELDFTGGSVQRVVANGTAIEARYNGFYLRLPPGALRAGHNEVAIDFKHPYSTDGSGLYRFRDPEDGRHYLYTDFEPYDQNRLFPSFDQPDLKARYTTTVNTPRNWQVIANTRETSVVERDGRKTWVFPTTLPISTYVYALHAGEFRVWESRAGEIPLRLFARESLARYVEPEHWFVPTRQGFEFFQRYFDVPYPFGKYDQVIVPHFNAGAMENVAAVTFSERYVQRGAVTRANRRSLASVILHEMAHMWFGDLVTMEWWNGLWLNESFATVLANIALVEATEFSEQRLEAYRGTVRAFQADERDTTHPIDLPIPDIDSAFANFDAITYEKGSATLMQLQHFVGTEPFREGVRRYLKTHSFGNTTLGDFLGAVSAAAQVDLRAWADDWLLEPGPNTVAVEHECRDGRVSALAVVQSAPREWPTLRTHRTQLGLYVFADGAGHVVDVHTVPVTYTGAHTEVPEAAGLPCPDMVYANHGNWDYARVRLDTAALPELRAHLADFDDPLARLMLWQGVWDLVLDARLAPTDYVDFVLTAFGSEANETIERQVLGTLETALFYANAAKPPASGLAALRARVEDLLWNGLTATAPGSDRQLLYYDLYVGVATTGAAVQRLAGLLAEARAAPAGLVLDQDRRWSTLRALAAAGAPQLPRLLATEREHDASEAGRVAALTVEVAQAATDVKTRWLSTVLDARRLETLADYRAVTGNLFPGAQRELKSAFVEEIVAELPRVIAERDAGFVAAYVRGLLGAGCTEPYLRQLEAVLASNDDWPPVVQRALKDARTETARCLRIAALEGA